MVIRFFPFLCLLALGSLCLQRVDATSLPSFEGELKDAAGRPAAVSSQAQANLRVYDAAWQRVQTQYYDATFHGVDWVQAWRANRAEAAAAVDDVQLYQSVNRMLRELKDAHTVALTPKQTREYKQEKRPRIGLVTFVTDKQWVVKEVLPSSPAALAGVKPGWVVLSCDGEPYPGSVSKLTEGKVARFRFKDEHDLPCEFDIVPKQLSTAPIRISKELPNGIVYLRFDEFDLSSDLWITNQLRDHRTARAVILDLRNNHGGRSFTLPKVIGDFFDKKVDVGTFISRDGKEDKDRSTEFLASHYTGKAIVLISGSSASAAEILAYALKQYGRATVVGRKTAGAVLGAELYSLPDGGQLEVSRRDYRASDGTRLEGRGVDPDISVSNPTLNDIRTGSDRDMEAALAQVAKSRS